MFVHIIHLIPVDSSCNQIFGQDLYSTGMNTKRTNLNYGLKNISPRIKLNVTYIHVKISGPGVGVGVGYLSLENILACN
jgi:hypothetical protein